MRTLTPLLVGIGAALVAAGCDKEHAAPPSTGAAGASTVPAAVVVASVEGPAAAGGFAGFLGDAARATIASMRGEPHDSAWDCADAGAVKRVVPGLGALPLVGAHLRFTLTNVTPAAADGTRVRRKIDLVAFAFADGRLRYMGADARGARPYHGGEDGAGGSALDELPPPLRSGVVGALAALRSPGCDVPKPTRAELDEIADATKSGPGSAAAMIEQGLANACRDAAGVEGGWRVRFDDELRLFLRAADQRLTQIGVELVVDGARACLRAPRVFPR